jgi:hypothetical protein
MPAGIPRRLTDEMARLGVELETYNVMDGGDYADLVAYTGVLVTHRGRKLGVAEMKPRGWGGDNKWRVYRERTPDGKSRVAVGGCAGTYNRQRDALAAIVRTWM